MNRKILAGVAIAVVGVVGVSAWLWSGNSSQKNDITLLGNVDIRQVSLAFQDSERIVEMRVEEGAKVTAGQVLAVLDTRTLELQAAQTEAQIEVNKKALLRLRNGSRPEEIGQAQARWMLLLPMQSWPSWISSGCNPSQRKLMVEALAARNWTGPQRH